MNTKATRIGHTLVTRKVEDVLSETVVDTGYGWNWFSPCSMASFGIRCADPSVCATAVSLQVT
jgi:hypothetical protein